MLAVALGAAVLEVAVLLLLLQFGGQKKPVANLISQRQDEDNNDGKAP